MSMLLEDATGNTTGTGVDRRDYRTIECLVQIKKTGTGTCTVEVRDWWNDALLGKWAIPATNPYGFTYPVYRPRRIYGKITDTSGSITVNVQTDEVS